MLTRLPKADDSKRPTLSINTNLQSQPSPESKGRTPAQSILKTPDWGDPNLPHSPESLKKHTSSEVIRWMAKDGQHTPNESAGAPPGERTHGRVPPSEGRERDRMGGVRSRRGTQDDNGGRRMPVAPTRSTTMGRE
jgi:hypothetical protein